MFPTRFNPPDTEETAICCESESLVRPEFQEECDVNRIMAKFARGGVLPAASPGAKYGDFSDVEDFRQAQDILLVAKSQFEGLPAKVRDRFSNDAASFLEFVNNPENLEEARKLGLLKEEVKPAEPQRVIVENFPTPEVK